MALPLHILDPPTSSKGYIPSRSNTITNTNTSLSPPVGSVPALQDASSDIPKPTRTFAAHRSQIETAVDSSSDDDDEDDGGGADSPRPGSSSSSSAMGDDYTIDEQVYVDVSSVPSYVPTHPLPEMQVAFEESMLDAGRSESSSSNYGEANPEKFSGAPPARRSLVLGPYGSFDNISYSARWRAAPESKHHPIVKIMSQVIFGVHLLCQAMEQSVPDVSSILRGFVQELDGFLRRVNGDFDLALKDVAELHQNLALPLQHVNVFDQLLDDRKYRSQTLEGNIRIDSVIKRYSLLTEDYTADLKALAESNLLFGAYLARIGDGWTRGSRELADINAAMVGNTAIWDTSAKVLGEKANRVRGLLEKCALCVFEFEKRCAAAARRSMSASRASSRLSNSRSFTRGEKPLPAIPSVPELSTPTPTPVSTTPATPSPTPSIQHRHQRSNSSNISSVLSPQTSTNPPPTATSATTVLTVPTIPSIASSSASTSRSRSWLARPAGLASRSMNDLRAAGFADSTSDLALFLRTTAPDPVTATASTTTLTAPSVTPPQKHEIPPKKKGLGSLWQVFRRKKTVRTRHYAQEFAGLDHADPSRPRTAPGPSSPGPPRPAHVPIAAFMGGVGQGPNGMGMSVGMSLSMTVPPTPGSVNSEMGDKARVRFDSLVGSGRQSRQSGRQSRGSGRVSRGSVMSGSLAGGSLGGTIGASGSHGGSGGSIGRLRLVFLERFRL